MPASPRLALAILLALGGLGAPGCTTSTELRWVPTPRKGVEVGTVLEPGQGFEGTLQLGNTRPVEGLSAPLGQNVTCDVLMAVVGKGPAGTEIRATFNGIDLDWDLPPAATYSSQELVELAQEQLRGMQVSFVVRPDGRVQALPAPPADAPPELREVIETMLLGLESFFVPLPAEPLRRGHEVATQARHDTAEGLSQALEQVVELRATYRHRDDDAVLRRVDVEQERREQRPGEEGPITVEREVQARLLLSTSGFPAEIDRQTRELDPVRGVVFRKVRASWVRTRGLVPELVAPPGSDVQAIADPCNPDYVGPATCEEPPAPTPPADDPPADDPPADDPPADDPPADDPPADDPPPTTAAPGPKGPSPKGRRAPAP